MYVSVVISSVVVISGDEVPCFVCMHFCSTLAIYVVKIAMSLYLGVVIWRIDCRPILDETVYFY